MVVRPPRQRRPVLPAKHHAHGGRPVPLDAEKYEPQKSRAVGAPGFCTWLIEEKRILEKNPTRGISMPRWLL